MEKGVIIKVPESPILEKMRELFIRGIDITDKTAERFRDKLHQENLPSPSQIDHLVTTSTFSPFSDKIMLFHKADMFFTKIRSFGNSLAVNARRDSGLIYLKALADVSLFVDDGTNILIENGWMEEPQKPLIGRI
ncbi:MAG TPA: DUF3231 family protein [Bacillus sp. (in: firmicutes)]|nr:DUF3231 family protein [Bacillus sp. (in: firmicutes)]